MSEAGIVFDPAHPLVRPAPRLASRPARTLRVLRITILIMIGLAGLALTEVPGSEYLVPVAVLVTCATSAVLLLFRDRTFFWSPLLWFLLACAAYFGLGPLLYEFAGAMVLGSIDVVFAVDVHALNATNVLNTISIAVVCLSFQLTWTRVGAGLARRTIGRVRPRTDAFFQRRVVIAFLVLGFMAKGVLWYQNLHDPDGSRIGVIGTLSTLTLIGLANLAFLVRRGDRRWLWLFVILGSYELLSAMASLMKQNVLEVLIAILAGLYLARPSRRIALTSLVFAGALYAFVLVPVVNYGRDQAERGELGNLSSLISGAAAQAESQRTDDSAQENLSAWQRLSYVAMQAFAMSMYDRGDPGDTFGLALYVLVPRALWPEKPIMTPGVDFGYMITGSRTSAASPGFFAEAYWNGGWGLVILACAFVGALFAAATTFVRLHLIESLDTRWLPVALTAMKLGYRPDDWFVASYLGWTPVIALTVMICVLAPRVRPPRYFSVGPLTPAA